MPPLDPTDAQQLQWRVATRDTYDYATTRMLLEGGHPVDDFQDHPYETALVHALMSQDEPMVKLLLEFWPDLARLDALGNAPIHYACMSNTKVEMMRLLLCAGGDVDQPTQYGQTPLLLVTKKTREDLMMLLLESGADINRPDHHGETPLMAACAMGWDSMVQRLLSMGADARPKDKQGRTVLDRYNGPLQEWLTATIQAQEIGAGAPGVSRSGPARRI